MLPMFSVGVGAERRLCVRARRRATAQLPRAECRGPPFDSSDSKVLHKFWGLVGCEAWVALLAIARWRVMQFKARDLWFLLGERGVKSTWIRVLRCAPPGSPSCPRTQPRSGETTSLPRVSDGYGGQICYVLFFFFFSIAGGYLGSL